ncbi:methyl-accepting chemotaxis protein [Kamptonema sp. UHCC 0994]|uniref:methyl-accepting chemotaxis protein n=1 Tax=Kamptonema sp. UHCC 0994 TaxID=3031329 RepID=UPI0023BAC542|nr:methyl-accepting chemotaxis protein [Kamptonema sp. UHCC 0994]MDF0556699.1 methyl-accepting chemotaxis protein [Kamptonema sp. UHCC 0994]
MATTTTDFEQEYQRAEAAYLEGNYEEAAGLVYQLVEDFPEDPSARLLCGHIYCYGLQQYDVAREQYMVVLSLTDDPGFVDHANNGIAAAEQFAVGAPVESLENFSEDNFSEDIDLEMYSGLSGDDDLEQPDLSIFGGGSDLESDLSMSSSELDNAGMMGSMGLSELDFENNLENYANDAELLNPFGESPSFDSGGSGGMAAFADADLDSGAELGGLDFDDGMALADTQLTFPPQKEQPSPSALEKTQTDVFAETSAQQNGQTIGSQSFAESGLGDSGLEDLGDFPEDFDDMFAPLELPDDLNFEENYPAAETNGKQKMPLQPQSTVEPGKAKSKTSTTKAKEGSDLGGKSNYSVAEDETLLMGSHSAPEALSDIGSPSKDLNSGFKSNTQGSKAAKSDDLQNGFNIPDSFDLDGFDDDAFADSFSSYEETPSHSFGMAGPDSDFPLAPSPQNDRGDWIDDFDEFGDVGNLPDFDISDDANSSILTTGGSSGFGGMTGGVMGATTSNLDFGDNSDGSAIRDDEIFSISGTPESVPSFTPTEEPIDATVTVEQGGLAFLENAPLITKQLYTAIGTGLISLVAVALVTNFASYQALKQDKPEAIAYLRQTGWAMTAAAGFTSFLTAWGLGHLVAKQVNHSTDDLQVQFDSVSQGNLEARATVYSEDEFGKMSAKFNHMAKVILTTTSDARRKADEQEQAKEDLQRQVIRLLDDVEGAARGDLTVQAEVTADVLGAVADSFNLTIQNLREIVHQVKQAARDVSTGASESATFAQGLSSDALRQAEELAATLNSVQVLTDAIQRVAESAREAEEVARGAAASAIKGGEAVERTVAGILEIRETVAETTRKVKRLAEASQEISKIVALIATIASRTNLLALNASIEAARAGEAGRGFAIVADEVRQLADRSAKSLKEIEQIVMQIQSETGAVMTAMEEGTQQVIEGTRLAEQAKRSLEDIIQVTNRIDVLVRSITADTIEQNQTASAVSHVMQAVELTAQETSQESQRVYGSLQNLVGVARDLLTSVERFRVETAERQ